MCINDTFSNPNLRFVQIKNKITLQQPSPQLVEQYLIEIANAHNIPFEPKQDYLMVNYLHFSYHNLVIWIVYCLLGFTGSSTSVYKHLYQNYTHYV